MDIIESNGPQKKLSQKRLRLWREGLALFCLAEKKIQKRFFRKRTFFEKKFSKDDTVSCSSCHRVSSGADSVAFSKGINGQTGDVNAPTVFNSSLNFKQFWDGRADSLTEQLEGPIHNPKEMGSNWKEIVEKLQRDAGYIAKFSQIYPDGVTQKNIADALIAFENALITLNSPFDKYLQGDQSALTETQISGYQKFTSYGCIACHQGRNVGGNMFQIFGVADDYFKARGGHFNSDLGRFNVTKNENDKHVFRVPSLRNVALTAPYFHDGTAKTLEEAVLIMGRYQLGRNLSETDVHELVDFLNSLTGETPSILKSDREVAHEH